jgi:hypothetical protein
MANAAFSIAITISQVGRQWQLAGCIRIAKQWGRGLRQQATPPLFRYDVIDVRDCF